MRARRLSAAALAVLVVCCGRRAAAEGPTWTDDDPVLAARRVRVSAGFGVALIRYDVSPDQVGWYPGFGLNLEEAVGIGHGLEIGARFGARLGPVARGLRADEVARGPDTETFGTGLDTWANPELGVRWRALRWSWGEAGFVYRVVLPIQPSPNLTGVLGGWARLHFLHRLRLDAALNGVVEVQSLAGGRVLAPGLGAPVELWVDVTRSLFAGLLATVHYTARTPYAESATRLEAGAGAGYRFRVCDLIATLVTLDATSGFTTRTGLGLGAACRL